MLQYPGKVFRRILLFTVYIAFAFAISCSVKGADDELLYQNGGLPGNYEQETFKSEAPASRLSLSSGIASDAALAEESYSSLEAAPPVSNQLNADRKKTFSGGCTIQTASPVEISLEISAVAEKYNGRVESSSESHITVRVPSAAFKKAFREILLTGKVIDKYEESSDVTDYYADLAGRLKILNSTRVRLVSLLSSEKETEKKVSILREIKRVDDQIGRIRAELEALESAISYSVITINYLPYSHDIPHSLKSAFPWIEKLDPFNPSIGNVYRKIIVKLPDEFAVIKDREIRYFHAEASDGTVVRIGTVKNDPKGDSVFWRKAINHTLLIRFAEAFEAESGNLKYILFRGKGTAGYRYLAGTVSRGHLLYVVEVFFPDDVSYERWMESLGESLGRLVIK